MQLVEHKCEKPHDEIALGLPATDFYCSYLDRIMWFRKELAIPVYLVTDTEVKVLQPTDRWSGGSTKDARSSDL